MKTVCVIPARMGSTRFPGKPMKPLLGLSMISHIYKRCKLFAFDHVIVATCDKEIFDEIENQGGHAVMTADSHERCTDRVTEAIDNANLGLSPDDLVVMVQGDEIFVTPEMLGEIVEVYEREPSPVVNLISRIQTDEDHDSPHVVKVVYDRHDRVLYMSRAAVPSRARAQGDLPRYQQTGIIGFKADFLKKFSALPPTTLEKIESCDMMRVVEHGLPIKVVRTEIETVGIDTPEDLKYAERILRNDPVTLRYLNSVG